MTLPYSPDLNPIERKWAQAKAIRRKYRCDVDTLFCNHFSYVNLLYIVVWLYHKKGWLLQTRHVFECADCHHPASITANTLFHNTKLPLVKWFWCIYWLSSDKGSISAMRLTKLIGVSWVTAQRMLRKLRIAMGDQNSLYKLTGTIELDDAFVGLQASWEAWAWSRRQDCHFGSL